MQNSMVRTAFVRLPLTACAIVSAAAIGACGGAGKSSNMSEEEAQRNWSAVARSLSDDGGNEQALRIDVSVDADVECRRGGDMSIDSQLGAEAEGGDLTIAFDLGIDYDQCRFDVDTIDGSLAYSATFVSERTDDGRVSQMTYTYNGLVTVTDADGTVRDCYIDAEGVAQAEIAREPGEEFRAGIDVRFTGTICGYDAEKIASASITITD